MSIMPAFSGTALVLDAQQKGTIEVGLAESGCKGYWQQACIVGPYRDVDEQGRSALGDWVFIATDDGNARVGQAYLDSIASN